VDAEKTVRFAELTAKEAGANALQEGNSRANEAKAAATNFMVVEDITLLLQLVLTVAGLVWVVAGSAQN